MDEVESVMWQDIVRMLFVKKQALAQDLLKTLKKLAQYIGEETMVPQMSARFPFPSYNHCIRRQYQNDECYGYLHSFMSISILKDWLRYTSMLLCDWKIFGRGQSGTFKYRRKPFTVCSVSTGPTEL